MTCKKKQESQADGSAFNAANWGNPDAKPITIEKLTKKFFMTLKTGHYLVSNIMISPLEPIFAETVETDEGKIRQWKRITTCKVQNRQCYVFKNKADHRSFFAPILERIAKEKRDKRLKG
jgi:hypothetical protein